MVILLTIIAALGIGMGIGFGIGINRNRPESPVYRHVASVVSNGEECAAIGG